MFLTQFQFHDFIIIFLETVAIPWQTLTRSGPTPQNDQTHSNNLFASFECELPECVWPSCRVSAQRVKARRFYGDTKYFSWSKKLSLISPKNNNSIAVLANKEKKFYPGRWIFFVSSICIHKVFIICLYSTLVVLLDSQSTLVSRILSMISKVYLEPCQISMMKLSRENSQRLSAVKYFCKIALSKIFTGF